jgi:hypothetical protein
MSRMQCSNRKEPGLQSHTLQSMPH